ncbi:MAG: DUF896 domain-containing protein [Clostridia bacterium]|nr:DUF896 domain-containing protein [Clostridia bacterium]
MNKQDIDRINELARKKKTVGLTASEAEEQQRLRRQYIDEFKANLKDTLDQVYIEREDGTYEKLKKKPPVN